MKITTHESASPRLIGSPIESGNGAARAELLAIPEMAVDEKNLIHGGFTFSLADFTAMIAVNHPHVVLGGSEVKFTAPVKVGDRMIASAKIVETKGRRSDVEVEVMVEGKTVLKGVMHCFILDKHVLN